MKRIPFFLFVAFWGVNPIPAAHPVSPLPDPLPLRRIFLPPDQVPVELDRARKGIWMQLTREELEARVQRAAQALDNLRNPPRLAEARYRATLEDTDLSGTAVWKILHPGSSASILPLGPLNLALRKVRIQKDQQDFTEAVLGDLNGKNLGLLVEQPGEHSVFLDWTARGEMGTGGLRFELQVPACLTASLEIKMPADRVVVVDPDKPALVTGPYPAESSDQHTWRIDFANRSQIRFVVRKTEGSLSPAAVLAHLHTRQDLGPDIIQAEFQFNLEVSKNGIREFLLECDPVLKPYEIEVNQLDSWELRPGDKADLPSQLAIQLREPFAGGPLVIRCLAPFSSEKSWTCPMVHWPGALDRGETLVVRVPTDVQLKNWRSGNYRFTRNATQAAGYQVLSLERMGPVAGQNSQRPSAQIIPQTPDVRCKLQTWWQIGATPSTQLTTQIQFESTRGGVFQLPILIPKGWQIDQVKMVPADLLGHWHLERDKGQSQLLVQLKSGLTTNDAGLSAANAAQLTIQLQPEKTKTNIPTSGWIMFPQVTPLKAFIQEAVLGISLDPHFDLDVTTKAEVGGVDGKGPWGRQNPDFLWTSRGHAVEGNVRLRSRPIQLHARCNSEVVIASGRAVVLTRLDLQPVSGNPDTIDVALSPPAAGPVAWKIKRGSNRIKEVKRLAIGDVALVLGVIGMRNPYSSGGLVLAPPPPHDLFRITLMQPLKDSLLLEATLDLVGQNRPLKLLSDFPGPRNNPGLEEEGSTRTVQERRWRIPLPRVLLADSLEGEVALYLGKMEMVAVEMSGLREGTGGARSKAAFPWRTFRYDAEPMDLVLTARIPGVDHSGDAVADSAQLTSFVEPGGRLLHQYRFQVRNWRQNTLPVRLPEGARLLAARIEGRWLAEGHLQSLQSDPGMVVLPISSQPTWHRFEIIYSVIGAPWKFWTRLEQPSDEFATPLSGHPWQPELPVKAIAFRHTWKLPPGVIPLFLNQFRRVPGSNLDAGPIDQSKWQRILSPQALLSSQTSEGRGALRNKFLEMTLTHLRKLEDAGSEGRLGDLLDQICLDEFQGQEHLIIDTAALNEAGIGPATVLASDGGSNPLEKQGMAIVSSRSALVLSTRRQLDKWESFTGPADSLPQTVENAVNEAIHYGQDSSHQFQTLVHWLTAENPLGDLDRTNSSLVPLGNEKDWTEWETLASETPPTTFVAIRRDLIHRASVALAMIILLAAWPLRHVAFGWRLGMLFLAIASAGTGLFWLPEPLQPLVWWPLGSGMVLAALWFGKSIRLTPRPLVTAPRSVVATGLAVVWAAGLTGLAAAPESIPVLIVSGQKDTPDKQTVLVPPDLLDQLQETMKKGIPDSRIAVVLAAKYQGKVTGASVEMIAEFQIHCLGEESALVMIPLGGVQIKEGLCDGAPAHLQHFTRGTPPQLEEGYTLEVQGKGGHSVFLRFVVEVMGKGDERDLKFSIPEIAQSRLTLEFLPGTRYLYPLNFRGAHRVISPGTADSASEKGTVLEVDLGRTRTLHVRWQESIGPPSEAALIVREGYFWNIRPCSSTLSAVLQYTLAKGSVSKLTLHLPEELVVLNIGVSRLPGDMAEDSSPRLQDWKVTGTRKRRHLELEFGRPVSGGVQVMLELVPDHILAGTVVLPFPHPINARAGEGVGKESLLAYRITGLKSQVDGNLRLTEIEEAPFTEFWRTARMGDPGRDLHAYRLPHTPGGAPFVRLKLQPLPDTVQGTQYLTWTVGRHRADFHLTAQLTSPDETLVLAEWQIPKGIILGEVGGAEVRNWSLTENRLQVWLQKPVKTATVQWTGWTTVEESKPPRIPLPSKEAPAIRFNLRPIRLIANPPATTYVQLTGVGDLKLKPANMRHLLPLPDTGREFENLEFVSEKDDYTATFAARKESTSFPARLLTLVEVIDRNLTFQTFIEGTIPQGESRTVTIHLGSWESKDVRLEAPGATWEYKASSDLKEQTFILTIPPGKAPGFQWKITGRKPLKTGSECRLPDITVEGVRYQERWLAITGKDLRGEDPRGLKPLANPLPALASWPAEAEKIRRSGTAWQVLSPDWHIRLTPFPTPENSAPIQVILADQTAAVVDGRHWVHQVTYWLMYEAGLDLHLTLPANARIFDATLDGTEVSPLQPEANRLWLPLAGAAGTHLLRLKWIVEEDPTQLLRPRLESLKIEGIPDPPTLWTIYVPAGYEIYSPLPASGRVSPAEHDLRRAEAQLQLSASLGERAGGSAGESVKGQLLTTQERFYRFIRTARHRPFVNTGLDARCKELKERNVKLAGSLDFEPIRVQAERQVLQHPGVPEVALGTSPAGNELTSAAGGIALQPLGTPVYWFSPAQGPGPTVHLIAKAEENRNIALLSSGILVVFLVSIWLLSFSPRMVSLFPLTWPEQLLLLAILGWVWLGSNWISLFLGAVGVIGRLVIAVGWILKLVDQRKTREAGQGSAMSAS